MGTDLKSRYAALHREMVEQLERTAALENHWLMCVLLGWEMLAACALSHYLLKGLGIQIRWPYAVVWLVQIFVALGTIKLVTGRPRIEESPLEPINKWVWLMFIFLSINVMVLNATANQPLFVFLPVLATLSSFAFTFMAAGISRRFALAGVFMFLVGIMMARFPEQSFLIYGFSWLLVLHAIAMVLYRRRLHWLPEPRPMPGTRVGRPPREMAMKS
jgi:hypothetical protein